MAFSGSDFNETEDFDEYNPYPYKGGYDIALTYGPPLPPSSAICYPLSSSSSSPPPPLPSPPSSPPPSRPGEPPAVDETPNPNPNSQESENHPLYDYGQPGYSPEPYSPDLSVFWPFFAPEDGGRGDGGDQGYWSQWRRAANYLFGYSQGYGERRIGIDRYGIPIYAYKSHINQPLVVEVEPGTDQKSDYYVADLDQFGWKDENNGYANPTYAYNRHYYEQPLCVRVDSIEPTLSQKLSYHEVYVEQVKSQSKWSSSSYDESAYDRHYYEQPLHVQTEPIESNWSKKPSYYEAYEKQMYPKSNWHSSYSGWGDERNTIGNPQHAYERHYNEQPLCIELEPFKPTWSQIPSYYEASEGELPSKSNWKSNHCDVYQEPTTPRSSWHSSSYGERRDESNISANSYYAEERHYSEQPFCVDLEPFKPTWSQNPSFYEVYEGDVSSNWNSSFSSEQWDGDIIGNPNYAYERHSYDQSLCVQIEPYKPTWSLNPCFYEVMEEASP